VAIIEFHWLALGAIAIGLYQQLSEILDRHKNNRLSQPSRFLRVVFCDEPSGQSSSHNTLIKEN